MLTLAAVCALMVSLISAAGVHGELTRLSSCICPGYEAVFECIVTGGGATTWNGTAFETCSNGNEIVLRHSIFNQSGWSQYCGDSGPIIVHTVSVMNETFTSQLVVNVSQSLNGTNVECSSSSGSRVGTKQIQLTTAPLPWPPPSNVILSQINSAHLTFTWNPVAPNCQAVHYEINVINCGQCPNTTSCGIIITCPISTDTNSVSCSINAMLNALPETCAIILQPVVCGSVYGNSSIFNVKDLCNNTCSDEGSNHNVTIGEGDGSPYPHTSTEYYEQNTQQSTNLNIILPSSLLSIAAILLAVVVLTIISCYIYRKQQGLNISRSTVSNPRDLNDVPKLQQTELIYMDVGPSIERKQAWIKLDDDRVEYATINHQLVPTENQPKQDLSTVTGDQQQLDLDSLLIQIRTQVTPKWYQFGLALGVGKDILNTYSKCPQEESIVEVADYWLRNSLTKPTWRDVAKGLKKAGFDSLAKDILNVYKTGNLPIEVDRNGDTL